MGGENTFTRTYNGEEIAGNVFETDGEQQGKNENARAVMGKEQANITHIIRLSIFSRLTQFVIASNVSNKCEERERESGEVSSGRDRMHAMMHHPLLVAAGVYIRL